MMPGPGAGDHHPVLLRHRLGELARVVVDAFLRRRARGAEDRDLAVAPPLPEDVERVGELLERGVDQLHLAAVRLVAHQAHRGGDHLAQEVRVRRLAGCSDELRDLRVELRRCRVV